MENYYFGPMLNQVTVPVWVDAATNGTAFGFANVSEWKNIQEGVAGTGFQRIPYSKYDKECTIDILECMAVAQAIAMAPEDINLVVYTDSTVALGAFTKGTSSSHQIRKILAEADQLLNEKGINLVVERVSTKSNPADYPSRNEIE